jgi:anion-transporting  ArsA/GET3 family ATPase
MHSPQQPSQSNGQPEDEFERSLADVERSLSALKQRYVQVQQEQQRQAELQQRLKQVKQQLHKNQSPQLQAELKRIKQQLEVIEVNLESQLFSWSSLKEPFWQVVRFGGLGVVVGWILKSCAN